MDPLDSSCQHLLKVPGRGGLGDACAPSHPIGNRTVGRDSDEVDSRKVLPDGVSWKVVAPQVDEHWSAATSLAADLVRGLIGGSHGRESDTTMRRASDGTRCALPHESR